MKGGQYKNQIKKLTLGLFDTLTDACLFMIFFHLQSPQVGFWKRGLGEAVDRAIHLTRIVHANSLDRIIYRATSKGYLEKKEDYLKITKLGKERLSRYIPRYEKERPWDGILYLVTYDIPETRKRERDYLRDYLEKLGCGRLQQSVWLTPYNPKGVITKFIKERKLAGLVLISELKEGSGIGGKDILEVIARIYKLDKINDEYRDFVKRCENKKLRGIQSAMAYLSILKKDPQLPFELLPGNWWGREAYETYKSALKK